MPSYRAKAIEAWDYFVEADNEEEARRKLEEEAHRYRNYMIGVTITFVEEVEEEKDAEVQS